MKIRLSIELVPKTTWYKNLRSPSLKGGWDKIRYKVFKRANYRCEICGGRGDKWPVECHEIWEYDDANKVQKLTGFIALCPDCHACKHIGLSFKNGKEEECRQHLAKINNLTSGQVDAYINQVFYQWMERSKHNWEVDITYVTDDLEGEQWL